MQQKFLGVYAYLFFMIEVQEEGTNLSRLREKARFLQQRQRYSGDRAAAALYWPASSQVKPGLHQ